MYEADEFIRLTFPDMSVVVATRLVTVCRGDNHYWRLGLCLMPQTLSKGFARTQEKVTR